MTDAQHKKAAKEMEVSIAAGNIAGLLYDAFAKQYTDPSSKRAMKSLNVLCVRLVFCLYAEDAGVFGHRGMFCDYLEDFETGEMREALIKFFRVLDEPEDNRDPYLADDNPKLAAFPYVGGGLFSDEDIEIPPFTEEIRDLLLNKASADFNWTNINPTIFGAVFESILNPQTWYSGGMHYISIENIHKVIDPLFLDDLKKELEEIKAIETEKTRERKLEEYQKKLASLKFLDPVCGGGSFLTETYLCIRRLENEVIFLLSGYQKAFAAEDVSPIKVSIGQFYGIEENDFAAAAARTALWIAESQMMEEIKDILRMRLDFLPLSANTHIAEGNALQMDWNDVVPKEELDYIMGYPPFAGRRYRIKQQTQNILVYQPFYSMEGFRTKKQTEGIDYKDIPFQAQWYYMHAAGYIQNTNIRCAFVSVDLIKGEGFKQIWRVFQIKHIHIDFAYRNFCWDSNAALEAYVHCVIIAFSFGSENNTKKIFDNGKIIPAKNINAYLLDAPDIFISKRSAPLCDVPKIKYGNYPLDGGALVIEEYDYEKFSDCSQYLKRLMGSRELLYNKKRYVLWLVNASPEEIRKYPQIYKRVEMCRENRLGMKDKEARESADTPAVFKDTDNPDRYIALPVWFHKNDRYIPMAYLDGNVIPTSSIMMIPDVTLYHFGILESGVHMAWGRTVFLYDYMAWKRTVYLYDYSDIVYNNFPWPSPAPEQKAKIEQTAQGILDARALYPDSSLAELYDESAMPQELRKAHQENDRAVMEAYGFPIKNFTEADCVAELMKMYQKLTP